MATLFPVLGEPIKEDYYSAETLWREGPRTAGSQKPRKNGADTHAYGEDIGTA